MNRISNAVLLSAVVACAGLNAAEVGSKAPAVEPSEWLNCSGKMSWKALRGQLIVVEKWATW